MKPIIFTKINFSKKKNKTQTHMREKVNSRFYKLAGKWKGRGNWACGRKGKINFKIMSIESYESQWMVSGTSRTGRNFPTDRLMKKFCKITPKNRILCLQQRQKMERQKGRKANKTWEGGRNGGREKERKYGCNQSS